jgi:hypothetical protein
MPCNADTFQYVYQSAFNMYKIVCFINMTCLYNFFEAIYMYRKMLLYKCVM